MLFGHWAFHAELLTKDVVEGVSPLVRKRPSATHFCEVDYLPVWLIMRERTTMPTCAKRDGKLPAEGYIRRLNSKRVGQIHQCVKSIIQRGLTFVLIHPVTEFAAPESKLRKVIIACGFTHIAVTVVATGSVNIFELLGNKPFFCVRARLRKLLLCPLSCAFRAVKPLSKNV
ncbi:hypothetical protein SDC9_99425 [bioreactor metagenome]|uniref:Uncharacterized protein n=1 Tax=bioreactor metagenome TaxID=1076179 RepID=A0A645AHI9_9ZZZZ